MIPSIARIVHYVLPDGFKNAGEHRAAIITNVVPIAGKVTEASAVSLTVFLDGALEMAETAAKSLIYRREVVQDPTGQKPGTWHECEKVG